MEEEEKLEGEVVKRKKKGTMRYMSTRKGVAGWGGGLHIYDKSKNNFANLK